MELVKVRAPMKGTELKVAYLEAYKAVKAEGSGEAEMKELESLHRELLLRGFDIPQLKGSQFDRRI